MKYLLSSLLFVSSIFCISANAQVNTRTQLWVDAHTSLGFLDAAPFQLGLGGGFQLSIAKAINYKSTLGVQAGFHQMGNYNRVYGEYTFDYLPNGFQYVNNVTKIHSIGFLSAGLQFKHRPNLDSPWSWSLGVNASKLVGIYGQNFRHYTVSTQNLDISEQDHSSNLRSSASSGTSSLSDEDFATYDISAEASLYYQITKGCEAKLAFRQGSQNLINPDVSNSGNAKHYLSMLSFGFSARIR